MYADSGHAQRAPTIRQPLNPGTFLGSPFCVQGLKVEGILPYLNDNILQPLNLKPWNL